MKWLYRMSEAWRLFAVPVGTVGLLYELWHGLAHEPRARIVVYAAVLASRMWFTA